MVCKDYKHGLYLLELFVLWLKISKCNCTYNQCANCISIYLSYTSMPIVSNNRLEKYLCYVVMIWGLSGRWPRRFLKLSKMQRGMQGAQGLHIQARGNMDLYMEHPKRKQSCSEPVQRASVSPCISFNSYWHSCMICVQWRIHEFKLPGANI